MVEQIGGFRFEKFIVVIFRFDNEFDGFFADFLRDFVYAFRKKF